MNYVGQAEPSNLRTQLPWDTVTKTFNNLTPQKHDYQFQLMA